MSHEYWTKELPEFFFLTSENRFFSFGTSQNQGWILTQDHGNPPALVIQPDLIKNSTSFKIFPCFSEGYQTVINPADFFQSPCLIEFQSSLVEYNFSPFKEINIKAYNWVPDPTVICGAFSIKNESKQTRTIQLDLAGHLTTQTSGQRMIVYNNLGRDFLSGQIGKRYPVIFMSGNTEAGKGPYPCLSSELNINPEQQLEIRWISVIGETQASALEIIDTINSLDWQGEISRLKIRDQSQLKIFTGNPEWDFAFKLSQKHAAGYIQRHYPQGARSIPSNSGLSSLNAFYLLNILAPIDPKIVPLIVENVMGTVQENDVFQEKRCDNQKTLPELPFTAMLVWQADQIAPGQLQIEKLVKQLEKSLDIWFQSAQDQDQDCIPELKHPCQLDLIDNRSPASIIKKGFATPDPYLESPGLAAILINDLTRLEELWVSLGKNKTKPHSDTKLKKLIHFLQKSWDDQNSCFLSRDRDSHLTLKGGLIGNSQGDGFHIFRGEFPQPTRLAMIIENESAQDLKPDLQITLHGCDWKGNYRIERISPAQIQWGEKRSWAISECIYSRLEYVLIENLGYYHCLSLFSPSTDPENIFKILPLWGKTLDKQKVDSLIKNTLTNKDGFWSNYGIRSIPDEQSAAVQLPWNLLIGKGLLHYNKRVLAAEIFSNIMDAVLVNLKDTGCFYSAYDARNGKGQGQKNALEGLIPIGFFLDLIGIQILNERELLFEGDYPFSWPVTIRYRGMTILRDQEMTRIDFPGEKTRFIRGSEKELIKIF
ncbi:MAG: hypothetical protein MUO54_12525 [Anaerolineales bacterium]|nr:hypothetical protein [Anaerolineales bacterium]